MCKLCSLVPPKYSAEFIGSMFFALIGCGVIITAIDDIGNIGVAAAVGMTYIALYQVIASVSGGYITPVFAFGGILDKRLGIGEGLLYILFQIFGAAFGVFILWACFYGMPYNVTTDATINQAGLGGNIYDETYYPFWSVALVEGFMASFLTMVYLGTTTTRDSGRSTAGLAIGMAWFAACAFALLLTDTAGINPARSIGAAVVSACFNSFKPLSQIWVFTVAPLIGSLFGFCMYKCKLGLSYKAK